MSSLFDHPMVTREQWENFTETDHHTWHLLFKRQSDLLKDRAANAVVEGMEQLAICDTHIPKFSQLNTILENETGFSIVPVKGFLPEDIFFRFLSERKFPSTCFIRQAHQLDYLEEPDIFHDVYGHVPLLVNPIFADFMQAFGIKGLEAMEMGMLRCASTLYWFTVEFGLLKSKAGLRIYGAGITSSKGESVYALDSKIPTRVKFNMHRIIKTQYHIDSFQKTYFVIECFQQLFDALCHLDWHALRETYLCFPDIAQGIMIHPEEAA